MSTQLDRAEFLKLLKAALESAKAAEGGNDAEASRAIDALRALSEQEVNKELVAETHAGKKIRKLSKHCHSGVASAASDTVKTWKKFLKESLKDDRTGTSSQSREEENSMAVENGRNGKAVSSETRTKESVRKRHVDADGCLPAEGVARHMPKTGDAVRDAARKNLAEVLKSDADVVGANPVLVAVEVEVAAFRQNGSANAEYKAKLRSLIFNIKDPENAGLRRRIVSGEVSGEVLVTLSSEELASEKKREEMREIRRRNQAECERSQNQQASTDQFQCAQCKQRKCNYYQLQTRSADEPMTTFVTCIVCGNRWKFC